MKFKKFDRRYLPMLWTGLVIWLGCMLTLAVLEWTGHTPEGQETVMGFGKDMFQSNPIATLLLLCLFQPILEEFGFRLWAVGKTWMTIVCLIIMAVFGFSEIGLWFALILAAFIIVWRCIKDAFIRNWANTLITSAAFALCHISGFGGFSLGMVLGLGDIFGMAIVMCWLVINLGFWFSPLLHVLNNSLAIVLPLIFLPSTATLTAYDGPSSKDSTPEYHMSLSPLHPFADNTNLFALADHLPLTFAQSDHFYLVGEPAEIAKMIADAMPADSSIYTLIEWKSAEENLEERVVLRVDSIRQHPIDYAMLLEDYQRLVKGYRDEPLTLDTTEIMLQEAWLVYSDGHEELLDNEHPKYMEATSRIWSYSNSTDIITRYETDADSNIIGKVYVRPVANPLEGRLSFLYKTLDKMYDYQIEYRDGIPARLVTIK